jgi:hypothetical protein
MADAGVKAIFNAARRYCMDRSEALDAKISPYIAARLAAQDPSLAEGRFNWDYQGALSIRQAVPLDQLPPFSPQEEDRANATVAILRAILEEIERRVADDFRNLADTRAFLVAAGRDAKVVDYGVSLGGGRRRVSVHEPDWNPEEIAARDQARAGYLDYVAHLSPEDAAGVPAAPYRRVMSESKRRRVARELSQRWQADPSRHYWHPLWVEAVPAGVFAAQDWYFHKDVGAATLQGILLRHGIARVWQISPGRVPPALELHPRLCTFSGTEVYWSSRELDWLVYTSHEASITFAGPWLVEELKRAWPTWERRVYRGYSYERSFT